METLDSIKALLPNNRHHLIDAAYAVGLNDLGKQLASKPRPAGISPAALPYLPKSLLYQGLLIKCQSFQLPGHRYDLQRDEKHRMGMIQAQTDASLSFILSILPRHLRIADQQGQLTDTAATLEYFDNWATLLWETMDAVLSCDDPVKAVAILRLLQHNGMDALQVAADPQPEMQAA